jgi:hypothetical protein
MKLYIQLNKQVILDLVNKNILQYISLWDTTENAINFYSKMPNLYTSFNDENDNSLPKSTMVKVFVCHDINGLMKHRTRLLFKSKFILKL